MTLNRVLRGLAAWPSRAVLKISLPLLLVFCLAVTVSPSKADVAEDQDADFIAHFDHAFEADKRANITFTPHSAPQMFEGRASGAGLNSSQDQSFMDGDADTNYRATAPVKSAFPKIAVMHAANQFFDQYVDQLSKGDLALLNFDREWTRNGWTISSVLKAIKAKNTNILLAQYTLLNEVIYPYYDMSVFADIYNKVSTERGPGGRGDWWIRDASGNIIGVYSNSRSINITEFVTPDSSGNRYPEWLAQRNYGAFFQSNPEFDIWFIDNVGQAPFINADWEGLGYPQSDTDPTVQTFYRKAFASYFDAIRKLAPSMMLMGNAGDPGPNGYLSTPEYRGKLEMAFFENVQSVTWATFVDGYQRLTANTTSPHLVVISMYGGLTDYQLERYGLAATLMGDGYFNFAYDTAHLPPANYTPVIWLDEFDLAGSSTTSWLGGAVDPPQYAPWRNGVYRRRFEHGMALVNPRGNGRQVIKIEPGYRRMKGNQDPLVNDGNPAGEVSLEDGTGLVLIKSKRFLPAHGQPLSSQRRDEP